jgi:head-tail adaptor
VQTSSCSLAQAAAVTVTVRHMDTGSDIDTASFMIRYRPEIGHSQRLHTVKDWIQHHNLLDMDYDRYKIGLDTGEINKVFS